MAKTNPSYELEEAYRERRPPRFVQANIGAWAAAVHDLSVSGHLGVVEHAARHLRTAFPSLEYGRTLCEIFDRMPRLEAAQPLFSDDAAKDVQVVARSDSEVVVLLFCGKAGGLGIPLAMVHPWLARLPANLVYLRDFRNAYYLHGVESLGPTRDATLTALRGLISSLNGRRVVCSGNCSGVFAGLDYGLELGADAVLCMGAGVNLKPDFHVHTNRETIGRALKSQFPDACLDMREAYLRAANPPRVCIVYGKDCWDDRIEAEEMGTLSCVRLHPIENYGKDNLIAELIRRGKFESLLDWMVHPAAEEFDVSSKLSALGKIRTAPNPV